MKRAAFTLLVVPLSRPDCDSWCAPPLRIGHRHLRQMAVARIRYLPRDPISSGQPIAQQAWGVGLQFRVVRAPLRLAEWRDK